MSDAIWIQMYHNLPPVTLISEQGPRDILWCMRVWDSEMCQAFEEAGMPDDDGQIRKIFEARTEGAPLEFAPDMDVYKLLGSNEQRRNLADRWADEAIKDCATVGGDDTYYDYYPDYLDGLKQLCEQIGYHEPINRAVAHALATTYKDDTEEVLEGYTLS